MMKLRYTISVLVFLSIGMFTLQAQPPGLRDITSRVTSPSGYECKDGRIDLIFNNGIPPYSVEWFRFAGNGQWESVASYEGVTGQDDQGDLEELLPGRYRAVVTDDLCGSGTLRFLLSPGENLINLVNIMNSSYCSDKEGEMVCDGQLSVSFNINAPFEFKWSGPDDFSAQTETITNLCGGTYEVEVTTESGCTFSEKFTICCCEIVGEDDETRVRPGQLKTGETCNPEGNSTITINTSLIQSPSTETSNDGFIEVNIWGGNAATIALSWTGPNGYTSFSEDIYNLGVGTYCLDVTDGCAAEKVCFEMVDCSKTNIELSATVANTCSGLAYGEVNVEVSGGTSPYRYFWGNGARVASISNLGEGSYSLTVYDSNGCSSSATYRINPNTPIQETRNECTFYYSCNGNVFREENIGSFVAVRSSDCRYTDTRCSDGVLINQEFTGTRFASYNPLNCSVREVCTANGQVYDIHSGSAEVVQLQGFDQDNGCWWCHDVYICRFPTLGGQVVINNVISHLGISTSPNSSCSSDASYFRIYCGNAVIAEGCSTSEVGCNSNLLGLTTEEQTETKILADGTVETLTTYKVVDFDPKLLLSSLIQSGDLPENTKLLPLSDLPKKLGSQQKTAGDLDNLVDNFDPELHIYPNPFTNDFTVKVTALNKTTNASILVMDSYGKVVYEHKISYFTSEGEFIKTMSLGSQPRGIYFVRLMGENFSVTKKLVKI